MVLFPIDVGLRTREIGIRMALGASRGDVFGLVIRDAARPATIGLGAGLLAAVWLTRLMKSFLFGVGPADPSVLMGVLLLILLVVLAACLIPAWRAINIHPVVALRDE